MITGELQFSGEIFYGKFGCTSAEHIAGKVFQILKFHL